MKSALLVVTLLVGISLRTSAQVDGLWLVTNVDVGGEPKTPVARWFRLEGGKQFSGNGWQRHTVGSYTWNKTTSELSFQSDNEPSDGFGAFTVSRKGNTMTWTRKEGDMVVKVSLEEITDLPPSTTDQVKGLWDLFLARRSGAEITDEIDPEGSQYFFIRWDRVLVRQLSPKERVSGFWFMNAHRPMLSFIFPQGELSPETWSVSFEENKMVLTGISENVKGLELWLARMAEFPK